MPPDTSTSSSEPNKAFTAAVVSTIINDEPAPGSQLRSHIQHQIDSLPEQYRPHGVDSLHASSATLMHTAQAFKSLHRNTPNDSTARKTHEIDVLDTLQLWAHQGQPANATPEPSPTRLPIHSNHAIGSGERNDLSFDEEAPEDCRRIEMPEFNNESGSDDGGPVSDDITNLTLLEFGSEKCSEIIPSHEEPSEVLRLDRRGKRKSEMLDISPEPSTPYTIDPYGVYDDPDKARSQIANYEWLSDDVIEMMGKRLYGLASDSRSNQAVCQFKIMNPGYIKFDQTTLARPSPSLKSGVGSMYDPMPNPVHRAEAERLATWFDPTTKPFTFREISGPRQPDHRSCGVYILMAAKHWLQGDDLPTSFEKPNELLLSLLATGEADSSTPSPKVPPSKRLRDKEGTSSTLIEAGHASLAEMHHRLRQIKSSLKDLITSEPRQTYSTLSTALEAKKQKLAGLESGLITLSLWVQDVRTYQHARQWMSQYSHAPGPNTDQIDGYHRTTLTNLQNDMIQFSQGKLAHLCRHGEDKADLNALEADLDVMAKSIEATKNDVQQITQELVREKELSAITKEARELVSVLTGDK
ncbi:unnamed protein product [Fusarium graminearum]|uniref:Ubiquitin-like protease family profile domain-containing protein n=1 Tax=Gibberella zeae TaxID=5518 RepID=A0A2H3FNF5_GIBZA|nr:hypothetical protein FGRA07_11733 [Fusarium graminearum]CAG2003672.1 unnamed protein product [Fusarium graminearum]